MSFERVKAWLDARGMAGRALEFDRSSATVPLAALAVGVEEARIAKTLSFRAPNGGALLIVAAGDARVNNAAFKFGNADQKADSSSISLFGIPPNIEA